ncbi:PolC-type DNA polymerase III [Paenibacillus paeoniae]|nr:3'-5' exonuclease [Paenibacillus paeoniae]
MKLQIISEVEYEVSELKVDNLFNESYCVFDLEATGINPERDHIIQIGAVRISAGNDDSSQSNPSFMTYVRSPEPISPFIEQLTGVTNEHIADAPCWEIAYEDFRTFAKDTILVTQAGYEYDWPLIQAECHRRQLPALNAPILDTKLLYQYLYPEEQAIISTNLLMERLGVDDSGLARHDALSDSYRIAKIFWRLLDQYRERSIHSLNLSHPMTIKRFQLPKPK